MMLPFFFSTRQKLSWQRTSDRRTEKILPGSDQHELTAPAIRATQHTYTRPFYHLVHRVFNVLRTIRLSFREKPASPGLRLEAVLTGTLTQQTNDGQVTAIPAGQYHITQHTDLVALFKGPSACSYFMAHYSTTLLQELGLQDLVHPVPPQPLTGEMTSIIHKALRHPHEAELQQLHYDHCIRELLLLHLTHKGAALPAQLSLDDLSAIYAADHLLQQQLKLPGDVPNLAQLAGVSESTLRRGFRLVFDRTVFERLTWHRLQYAMVLLRTTNRTIEDIGLECGYGSRTSFIAAFKHQFRLTPGKWKLQVST